MYIQTHLSIENDCTWLALCTNTFWPWRVFFTARFYFTINIFQCHIFTSKKKKTHMLHKSHSLLYIHCNNRCHKLHHHHHDNHNHHHHHCHPKGDQAHVPTDPISLLCYRSKVLDATMSKRLMSWAENTAIRAKQI